LNDANEPAAEFDAALVAFGLQPGSRDDAAPAPDELCYLWPCNVRAWNVWQQVQTQWRVGMGGREGLDYGGVQVYLASLPGLRPKARAELWAGLRAMEHAALAVWAEQRE
jgi:hypothetical protein